MMLVGQPGCQSSLCPVAPPGIPDAQIVGNTFENNVAQRGGGAMYLWHVGEPLIENNIFRFNQTDEGGGAIDNNCPPFLKGTNRLVTILRGEILTG
jgi:parallel beta-helix repeat protein